MQSKSVQDYLKQYTDPPPVSSDYKERKPKRKKKSSSSNPPVAVKKVAGFKIVDVTEQNKVRPAADIGDDNDSSEEAPILVKEEELLDESDIHAGRLKRAREKAKAKWVTIAGSESEEEDDLPRKVQKTSSIATVKKEVVVKQEEEEEDLDIPRRHSTRNNEEEDLDSLPRKHKPQQKMDEDDDNDSLPRRHGKPAEDADNDSLPRRHKPQAMDEDDNDALPRRHKPADEDNDALPRKHRPLPMDEDDNDALPRKHKSDEAPKMSDGERAGLFSAKEVQQEDKKRIAKELADLRKQDPAEMGLGASTIYRDSRGRPLTMLNSIVAGPGYVSEESRMEWGVGEKEDDSIQKKHEEDVEDGRGYHGVWKDDAKLNAEYRGKIRFGDPMAKEAARKADKRIKLQKIYTKPFPPNRFNLRPGWRWDGIDRSNKFEEKLFQLQNEKQARAEELMYFQQSDM